LEAAISAGLSSAVLLLLTLTLSDHGLAWDEGFTVERVDRLREWFSWVGNDTAAAKRAWSPASSNLEPRPEYLGRLGPSAGSLWERETLRFFWPFAREEPNGHPPFYALLSLAGLAATWDILPPPACYRFGPASLFALTVGAVYWFMARHYGRIAGLMAALGLLTMPRVFAHAHLASYDAPTLCLWFLAVAAFYGASAAASATWLWMIVFGVAWGCAAATKLTGWFLPIPLAAWAILHRDRRAARTLLVGAGVAALILYLLIPPWWADPIGGVWVFLRSNLGRESRSPIPTLFLGRIYPFALPWYNTLVWTAIVVPPATLVLAVLGSSRVIAGRLRDRAGSLLLLCWAFLMVLRALPAAPGHDGERQFLPAFAFLACLAGVGVAAIPALATRASRPRLARPLATVALTAAVFAGAWSTWQFHPLQLSYYNTLIGGLSGAARMGMEPTYYWDALTPDTRDWVNRHTELSRSVIFVYPLVPFEYLHHWGLLSPTPIPDPTHPPQWFLVQNRPGTLRSYPPLKLAAYLLEHVRPVHAKVSRTAPGVPLVAIYAIKDAALAETKMDQESAARAEP
jgi:4-amino-4-deoxy-L-arabinose transferase-like glycosyltransferase